LIKDPLLETKIKKSMFAMKQLIAKTGKNSSLKGYLTDRVNTCSPEKMQSSPKSPTLPKFNSGSAENKQEYSITLNKSKFSLIKFNCLKINKKVSLPKKDPS